MRKKIVAGNWKMNNTLEVANKLMQDVNAQLEARGKNCDEVILGVPALYLIPAIEQSGMFQVAAQNCSNKISGAYTGEISASMLASTDVMNCILGHSERRAYYGETNEIIKEKVDRCLENGVTPIFCCGEVLEERKSHKHFEVVESQINEALFHLSAKAFGKVVIAYEPVWAIGTGETASPAQAQEMHAFIRSVVATQFGDEVANDTTILYGGSCKGSNAKELFACQDVDGGLIGGASLDAAEFITIANSF